MTTEKEAKPHKASRTYADPWVCRICGEPVTVKDGDPFREIVHADKPEAGS